MSFLQTFELILTVVSGILSLVFAFVEVDNKVKVPRKKMIVIILVIVCATSFLAFLSNFIGKKTENSSSDSDNIASDAISNVSSSIEITSSNSTSDSFTTSTSSTVSTDRHTSQTIHEDAKVPQENKNILLIDSIQSSSYSVDPISYSSIELLPTIIWTHNGDISFEKQIDDYDFTPAFSGAHRFEFSSIISGTYLRLRIYNSGWEQIKSDYNLGNGEGLTVALKSEETYHIRVEQYKNFGTYTLNIGPKKSMTDITGYTTVSDSIEYTDQENDYSFIANTSGTYRFEFSGIHEGTYFRLRIFNSGWEPIKSESNLDNNDGLTVSLISGETYYVRVQQNKNLGNYTLNIGFQKPIIDITNYTIVSDSIQYTDQKNDYSFKADNGGTYRFEFSGIHEGTYFRLRIFNSGWEPIKSESNLDNNDGLTVSLTSGEIYYVRVQQNSKFGDYTLNIGLKKTTRDITNYIGVSDSIQYTDQENDYSLTANISGTYSFQFSEVPSGTCFRLRIFNAGREQIKTGYEMDNDDSLTVSLSKGETYYIRVGQYKGIGDYSLFVARASN